MRIDPDNYDGPEFHGPRPRVTEERLEQAAEAGANGEPEPGPEDFDPRFTAYEIDQLLAAFREGRAEAVERR